MKAWFHSLSLHHKQILVIIMINAFTLMIASTLYFYNNVNAFHKNVVKQLEGSSQIIAGSTTSSLLFYDTHAAHEQLNKFITDETILYAGVFDEHKDFFASFNNTKHYPRPDLTESKIGLSYIEGGIQIVTPIVYDDETIGYVLIVQDINIFRAQTIAHLLITLSVFVMSLIFAWALSTMLQRWLNRPIKDFVQVIDSITSSQDYSQRLQPKTNDEIGKLMRAFNTMLDAVKERDDQLKSHGDELEDLVNLRTRQLHQRSNYDSLTQLPNRHFFIEQLEHQIKVAHREKSKIAVLFLDLDRFKIINDNLGHATGDQVLKIIAERLETTIRGNDTVARWGGDEFVIFLSDIRNQQEIEMIIKKITEVVEEVIHLADRQFHISTSLGISRYPSNGKDAVSLLKNADVSVYRAKEKGAGNHAFYVADMDANNVDRLSMETKLRRAIENNQLTLVYQPKVDIKNNKLSGVEALIRWHDDELGFVPPSQFIPLAEEIGIIHKIGEFVIRTACKQNASWRAMGLPSVRIAVNLSPSHLSDPKIVEHILKEMEFYKIEPSELELEITEETFLDSSEQCKKNLSLFHKFGLRISIDDFGTGYSCLSYLLDLPVTTLKIDGSFIKKLGTQPENDGIVNAIMTLGHGLGLDVVAECVETKEQLDFLQKNGCDVIQGYYFSKPLKPDQFVDYMNHSKFTETATEAV
ncbi:MAG: EAL domain-containing protein [Sinobacterium sp.]|nr:EAL domain-containing protein [Sinobacterium sp.]